jgi:endonuclease/exonuclease/phosphatase family metal-dependent hydrolase
VAHAALDPGHDLGERARHRRDTIQLMLDSGYADAWRTRHPTNPGPTFPTWDPHVRLDYVFVPAAHAARIAACEILTDLPDVATASDHFPLLTVFESERPGGSPGTQS